MKAMQNPMARKRPVNLTLNEDLVTQARALTDNLSGVVESLLTDDIPYVVLVQSSLYDSYRRRVVVPLVKKSALGKIVNPLFNPAFKIESVPVVLHPLEIVSVPSDQLGEFVISLRDHGDAIAAALDELLTQAWR